MNNLIFNYFTRKKREFFYFIHKGEQYDKVDM